MFLHHIVRLHDDDPVKVMLRNLQQLSGEKNWWSQVSLLLVKYEISLDEVESKSRETFKELVKSKIKAVAFKELHSECMEKSKTKDIVYSTLKVAEYLQHLYPPQSKVIFQARSKTLDIKEHRQYKYSDMKCRRCKVHDETFSHIVNCGHREEVDASIIDTADTVIRYYNDKTLCCCESCNRFP